MGCSYSIDGEIRLRKGEETDKRIEALNDAIDSSLELNTEVSDDEIWVEVHGSVSGPYSWAVEICEAVKALGEFAVKPAKFLENCDGDPSTFWVGEREAVAAAESRDRVEEALGFLRLLEEEEVVRVLQEFAKGEPNFRYEPDGNFTYSSTPASAG